ncbi:MAG: glycosyltransferase family 4 protein, partial [Blastocatellia bacterium]|nr:glycosyltransferase family 4 protein [Blastocatellia bacterium]
RLYEPGGSFVGTAGKAAGFVRPVLRRVADVARARKFDLLFVQREAMLFGPAVFETLMQRIGRLPMVLDLDDATYVAYNSPTYGRLGSSLKFFGKTDRLIDRAAAVTCGNRFIAEYVERRGARAVVVPTVVDTEVFRPLETPPEDGMTVIGWVGTHSTFPSLEFLFPVLQDLATKHTFRLRVVGTGRDDLDLPGVEAEFPKWSLENEVADFRQIDIGLYPIVESPSASEEWLRGKSGFKAVQYMAVGVPFVMSPVGICAEMGLDGETHISARSEGDWYNALDLLLGDVELRRRMGAAGRRYSLEHFTVEEQADKLAEVFRAAGE